VPLNGFEVRDGLTPVLWRRPSPPPPEGHSLGRGVRALLVERRLPYRLSVALDRFCNRIGWRYKTTTAAGIRMRVRRQTCDEDFVRHILVEHDYTPPGFDIGESDVVIDIGGNIGTFALHAARCARRGTVYTFEPNSENYDLLIRNIALNDAANIVPARAALSGTRGQLRLFTNRGGGGFHSVLQGRAVDETDFEMVDTLALRDVIDDHGIERCAFLKLDCEGAEYAILDNLPDEYFARIDKIVMEYHVAGLAEENHADADRLVARLQRLGFHIEDYRAFVGFDCGFIRARRR
jgi:FkbM family methyltransferase